MTGYAADSFNLGLTVFLIILNGYFVAAEFALVKVNKSKIKAMQKDGHPFAAIGLWLYKRQNMTLSACQMGITMASLALGWIGEPALAHLIHPVLESMGITSEAILHGIAFAIAFTIITSLHIVIGEQVPKIYAIRQPIAVIGWASLPLKGFYIIFYPFMWVLDWVTSKLLMLVGIESSGEHDSVLSEEEIRASLSIAYSQGDLTKYEHRLLDAAFKFDDQVTRHIMLPRAEIVFFDATKSTQDNLEVAKNTQHTRFPLCSASLDTIHGVIHVKDLVGVSADEIPDLKKIARPAVYVPESLPISVLLQEFKKSKQHLAFVEDEHSTVIGIVSLENVLEELVGNVQDEFDSEEPEIVKESEGKYIVDGDVTIKYLNEYLDINLETDEADTLNGLLVERKGMSMAKGGKLNLDDGITVEILTIENRRAIKVRLLIPVQSNESDFL